MYKVEKVKINSGSHSAVGKGHGITGSIRAYRPTFKDKSNSPEDYRHFNPDFDYQLTSTILPTDLRVGDMLYVEDRIEIAGANLLRDVIKTSPIQSVATAVEEDVTLIETETSVYRITLNTET